jgi:hypothetical protein
MKLTHVCFCSERFACCSLQWKGVSECEWKAERGNEHVRARAAMRRQQLFFFFFSRQPLCHVNIFFAAPSLLTLRTQDMLYKFQSYIHRNKHFTCAFQYSCHSCIICSTVRDTMQTKRVRALLSVRAPLAMAFSYPLTASERAFGIELVSGGKNSTNQYVRLCCCICVKQCRFMRVYV